MKFLSILLICISTQISYAQRIDVDRQMHLAVAQYKQMVAENQDSTLFPQSVLPDGRLKTMTSEWWCSGFFGGSLWYLYEYTQDPFFLEAAKKWTSAVEKEQYNTSTHDLGFMLYCPYGNGFRITGDLDYIPILLHAAQSLSTRFDVERDVIKSWDTFGDCSYPVIIDNMMNLELLFWATRIFNDEKFYNRAIQHADNTIKNHFRDDHSSYHVLCYDSTGNVTQRRTAQGYADESSWARGQAWGLYGFVMTYRETNEPRFLEQAIKIADFITTHPNLPEDKIPYWDFNAPNIPNEVRDASCAAIAASALLELSHYVDEMKRKQYFDFAEKVLVSLSSPEYFAAEGNHHFLLKHSTGHKPMGSEVDTPIIYADYYYIEALMRYDQMID